MLQYGLMVGGRRIKISAASESSLEKCLHLNNKRKEILKSMVLWEEYYVAKEVDDALQALAEKPGSARVIAGGTDLLLDMQQGRVPPVERLVDVTAIPEMSRIEEVNGNIFIGAGVPLNQITASKLVRQNFQCLLEACGQIGGLQVRNTATLGGNIGHALPAADGTIALLALGAKAEVASLESRSILPVEELFVGPGVSALDHSAEFIVGFQIPSHELNTGSAFKRVMRPQGVAIAILNMAIWMKRQAGTIEDIRIAIGPAGPIPFRAYETENFFRGKLLEQGILSSGVEVMLSEVHFRTSPHRSTSAYRKHVAEILLKELLNVVWNRIEEQVD